MIKNDKLQNFLKRPYGFFLILIYTVTILSCGGAIFLAVKSLDGWFFEVLSYTLYAIAAITLGYSVYTVVIYAPNFKRNITATLKKNSLIAKIMDNYGFKTLIFSLFSFSVTVVFVLFNLVSAIRYRLIWYYAISGYYFVLLLFRGGILLADNKCRKKYSTDQEQLKNKKWRIYLSGGIILSLLEIAMAVAVTEMMLSKRPIESGMIMAIANATYTFYKMSMATYNLIKAKKYNDPSVQALRNINFADACMAIVSLTVTMLSTFGENDLDNGLIVIKACVGFAACTTIIAMAILMIERAVKEIKSYKGTNKNER